MSAYDFLQDDTYSKMSVVELWNQLASYGENGIGMGREQMISIMRMLAPEGSFDAPGRYLRYNHSLGELTGGRQAFWEDQE